MVVGTLADIVEDQMRRLLTDMGIRDVDFFPPRNSTVLPEVGPDTVFLLAQPFYPCALVSLEFQSAARLCQSDFDPSCYLLFEDQKA